MAFYTNDYTHFGLTCSNGYLRKQTVSPKGPAAASSLTTKTSAPANGAAKQQLTAYLSSFGAERRSVVVLYPGVASSLVVFSSLPSGGCPAQTSARFAQYAAALHTESNVDQRLTTPTNLGSSSYRYLLAGYKEFLGGNSRAAQFYEQLTAICNEVGPNGRGTAGINALGTLAQDSGQIWQGIDGQLSIFRAALRNLAMQLHVSVPGWLATIDASAASSGLHTSPTGNTQVGNGPGGGTPAASSGAGGTPAVSGALSLSGGAPAVTTTTSAGLKPTFVPINYSNANGNTSFTKEPVLETTETETVYWSFNSTLQAPNLSVSDTNNQVNYLHETPATMVSGGGQLSGSFSLPPGVHVLEIDGGNWTLSTTAP